MRLRKCSSEHSRHETDIITPHQSAASHLHKSMASRVRARMDSGFAPMSTQDLCEFVEQRLSGKYIGVESNQLTKEGVISLGI